MPIYRVLERCFVGSELREVGDEFTWTFAGQQVPPHIVEIGLKEPPAKVSDKKA